MQPNEEFAKIASSEEINRAIESLKQNGIEAQVADHASDVQTIINALVPEGAEVFTMTSVTLDECGVSDLINESGKYDSVRNKLNQMKDDQGREKKRLGAAPEYTIGSVHALTQDGKLLIASNTGSQLAAYAYGADKVIWVVGAQKIVKDFDEGIKRLYEYSLPLEKVRAKQAYGIDSFVSKILMIHKEKAPGRAHLIIIKQKIGF